MSNISSDAAFIPSFLKRRISSIDNPHPSVDLKSLFLKYPKEILLKSYKCSLRVDNDHFSGKLYISTNYLCFVSRPKKILKVFIRLSDVTTFEARQLGFFHLIAYNKAYNFYEFIHASALSFLSNYLRLGHCGTTTSTHWNSKSTLNTSSTISTDNMSTSISSQISNSRNSPSSVNSHLDSSADPSSVPSSRTQVSESENSESKTPNPSDVVELCRDCSSFTVKSPSFDHSSERLNKDETLNHVIALRNNSNGSFKNKEQNRPPSQFTMSQQNVDNFLFSALYSLSEVAFQASCIPLSLLCRFICGAFNMSIHLPSRAVLPSRSFTILIAYVVLAFLAISMAYIYYKIETFHQSLLQLQTRGGAQPMTSIKPCDHEIKDIHSALSQLFGLSSSLLLSVNNIAATYGIDFNSSHLSDIL